MSYFSLQGTIKNGITIAAVTLLAAGCKTPSQWWQGAKMSKDKNARTVGFEMKQHSKSLVLNSIATSGNKGMKLNLNERFKPDQRIKLSINFTPEKAQTAWADLMTGCGRERLRLNVKQGMDKMSWYVFDSNGKNKKISNQWWNRNDYFFNAYAQRNFSWPDELLQWTEHYSARNVPLNKRWFDLQYVIRKQRCQLYIDGILLDEWTPSPGLFQNRLKINTSKNVSVKPAVITALSPENILYQPVNIGYRLNSSGINGQKISSKSLPPKNELVIINKVPFEFPHANEQGQNNIDIGFSWFRCGNLKGSFSPRIGSFGGRWYGALNANPTRIQFRLPNRQYDSVYVIAASDNDKNSVPKITAQFYRPCSGFPKSFESPDVPAFTATSSKAIKLPVKTTDGSNKSLWLIKIPVNPGDLQEFSDLNCIGLELTKQVQLYRCYPDPSYYSEHGAGLPSSVHVFALTLGVAPVKVDFTPDRYANIWTTPEKPSYTVKLQNRSTTDKKVELELTTKSYDGKKEILKKQSVRIKPGESKKTQFKLDVKNFGWHSVELLVKCGKKTEIHKRSLAFLRKQNHQPKKYNDDGHIFGFWNWRGEHLTPSANDALRIIGPAGGKSMTSGIYEPWADEEFHKLAEKYGIKNYLCFGSGDSRYMAYQFPQRYFGTDYDPKDPERMHKVLLKALGKKYQKKSKISEPTLVRVFAEPGGIGTHGTLPEFYGAHEHKMSAAEKNKFEYYKERFLMSVKAVKQKYPDAKILMPHGDPTFAIPFLKENGEIAKLLDGAAVDIGYFERLPEQQFHQCSIHRIKQFVDYWKKYKKTKPVMATFEGPCIAPVTPGALTEKELASHTFRSALLLAAYGVNRQFAAAAVADCASYWGEQHYGGGLLSKINSLNPHVVYAVYATMARHLADFNFERWIPTGSLSVYCLQFKNNSTNKYMYVLWTIRGKRKITMHVSKNAKLKLFDSMDNDVVLKNNDGKTDLIISKMPSLVYGAGNKIKIQLGTPDHSDSKLGEHNKLLMNCGKMAWKQVQEKDETYVDAFPECIRRFPAEMQTKTVTAPTKVGSRALAVKLPPQDKDRGVMPFYTTLYPQKQITIPGKAQYLSTWVKAASDWGRIVYVLKDAKGEKWISVGSKNQWNCDDTHGWSKFCYDGWRLLKFELPSHAPYDNYRENGTTWWGSSEGDGIVDLPLKLEKIMIERRPKAMYVNSLEKTDTKPVELANMYAEYADKSDMDKQVIELSKIKMPQPTKVERLNPISELMAKATLPAGMITSVRQPEYYYDGTRGIFDFKEMPKAFFYDIWLSKYPDGRGAIKLGKRLRKSGSLVRGFLADTDFYAFVVYYDRKGNSSKPSKPFKFRLKDMFAMK